MHVRCDSVCSFCVRVWGHACKEGEEQYFCNRFCHNPGHIHTALETSSWGIWEIKTMPTWRKEFWLVWRACWCIVDSLVDMSASRQESPTRIRSYVFIYHNIARFAVYHNLALYVVCRQISKKHKACFHHPHPYCHRHHHVHPLPSSHPCYYRCPHSLTSLHLF